MPTSADRARRDRDRARDQPIPGTRSAFAERPTGGFYLDFDVNREAAARHGLRVGDVNDMIDRRIGGKNVATTVEGRERYPIAVRYAREFRDDLDALKRMLVTDPRPARRCPMSRHSRDINYKTGPPSIRSEDGSSSGSSLSTLPPTDIRRLRGKASPASASAKRLQFPAG